MTLPRLRCWSKIALSTIPGFDLLSLDPALDLQMRAPGGFMRAISRFGAHLGQTLTLLNGMRLDDVQTGHFNLDLPIPMEMISGMEVLKGSGSTLYGSDAIGGVVNVIANPIDQNEFRLLGGGGNFRLQRATRGCFVLARDGGAKNWRAGAISLTVLCRIATTAISRWDSLTQLKSRFGAGSILFAYSDKPYGADQFYGPYPSWERIKTRGF